MSTLRRTLLAAWLSGSLRRRVLSGPATQAASRPAEVPVVVDAW